MGLSPGAFACFHHPGELVCRQDRNYGCGCSGRGVCDHVAAEHGSHGTRKIKVDGTLDRQPLLGGRRCRGIGCGVEANAGQQEQASQRKYEVRSHAMPFCGSPKLKVHRALLGIAGHGVSPGWDRGERRQTPSPGPRSRDYFFISFNAARPFSVISQTPRCESALSKPSRTMLFRAHWAALRHRGLSGPLARGS